MSTLLPGMIDAAALTRDTAESCDVAVIGSGAGGAVVAKELAEAGLRVIVLEEGAFHTRHHDLAHESIGRMYRDAGITATLGRPLVAIPLGRCAGGTTTVNSGTCFRTPENVLSRWRGEFGITGLDSTRMDRVFRRVEQELHVEAADFAVMSRSNTLTHELLARTGRQGGPLRRNTRGCEGCGMCCYGCTSGAKQSMTVSYLPKALNAGAVLYLNARVRRVLRGCGNSVQGVEAVAGARKLMVHAPIVIVACGTMVTPQLLKENGIARWNRHLGRHLTLHPASKVVGEFSERIDSWDGIPQAYGYEGLHNDGLMFEGISMPPDLGAAAVPFTGDRLAHYIKNYAHMASFGFMITDTAEGRMVRLPLAGYRFFYSLTPTDVRRIKKAIVFLARLYLDGGALRAYAMVNSRNNVFHDHADVDRFERTELRAGDIETMAFHPLGTCRMAASPAMGVCDSNQQVFGVPGLYVCDGSVVPTPLGVNPQETIMALASRLAEHLLGKPLSE